ncbi:MAG: toll/interleukin-1 receptor domain-containing protein [Acidimicrobiia bacterium]|nr:toll/interleukin-1 receptor domain-containing protein [Acidimicrobiia bacterium]NNL98350.1 toll/interleukin-1 receptor domain-containing protein [Acidimicrobiia bacterium]
MTEALDASEWFVLLLSPEAAASEWVNREVSYWLEHRDPGRILPVVTSGDHAGGDRLTGCRPPTGRGRFHSIVEISRVPEGPFRATISPSPIRTQSMLRPGSPPC